MKTVIQSDSLGVYTLQCGSKNSLQTAADHLDSSGKVLEMNLDSIIKAFFDAANSHDLVAMDHLFSERVEFYFPKTKPLIGKKRVLRFFTLLFKQYPQLTFHVHMIIAEANKAAVHWTNKGANRKGDPYENEGVTILRFETGKICFLSDFFKDTGKF